MKKFRYLLFIFIIILCMIPNVNAETLDFRDSDIRSFTYCRVDGTCEFDASLPIEVKFDANHQYYGANMNPAHQLFQININRSHFNGINDGDSVSFYMYDNRSQFMKCGLYTPNSNWLQQNSNSFLPLVTLNNYYCNVNLYGITGSSSNTCEYEKRFYVTCPYYKNTSYDYDYIQSYYENSLTSSAGTSEFFGITTMYVSRSNNTTLKDIEDNVNDLNDNITDGSVDSSDSTINNLKDKIPTNSVISDLLLLPVRFLQNFVNALSSSCSSFSLGSLYGTELFMPCINIQNYLGSGIWTTIDLIISGLFIYSLRKKFIEIYENLTNLTNGGNEVD